MGVLRSIGVIVAAAALCVGDAEDQHRQKASDSPFFSVDLLVEPGGEPLAAWQLAFHDKNGAVRIVGIEGGEHAAFSKAPYFDPQAMAGDRVLLGAYSTDGDLPVADTRVARVHLERLEGAKGAPSFELRLLVAVNARGRPLDAVARWKETR